MPLDSFKPAHRLASISVICLSVVVAVYFLDIIYNLVFVSFFPHLGESAELTPAEMIMSFAAFGLIGARILFYIASIVFFLMWLHRAYKNLEAFNVQNLETSAGWAVGYWFIPILNLFKPLKVVNELYHGSDPENADKGYGFSDTKTPGIHGLWWACWLLSNFTHRIAANLEKAAKDVTDASVAVYVVSLCLGIIAGITLIFIIRDINRRQLESRRKLSVSSPPAPPVFTQPAPTFNAGNI